jgi:hypothetical protein
MFDREAAAEREPVRQPVEIRLPLRGGILIYVSALICLRHRPVNSREASLFLAMELTFAFGCSSAVIARPNRSPERFRRR